MARLFGDGFDHYGSDETNMLDGVYAKADHSLSTFAATGTHSILCDANGDLNIFKGLRKVLPASTNKLGVAGRLYFPALPSHLYECAIFDFISASSLITQVSCYLDTNGAMRFVRGQPTKADDPDTPGGTLIATTDPIIVASAWNHVEVQVYIHDTLGWIRVAVNGVHRYEATGLDTKYDATNVVSVGQRRSYLSPVRSWYMDDYHIYDFTGTAAVDTDWCPAVDGNGVATDYIGELQAMLLQPTADTAEDDWVPSTGSDAYAMIDEATPNDADYDYSAAVDDLSEFAFADLPEEITYIRGVDYWGRMSKSDSGSAMTKFGMKSDAATEDAAERPITVEPTYWWDQFNVDPDSTSRWTRTGLNAAWVRLTRSV